MAERNRIEQYSCQFGLEKDMQLPVVQINLLEEQLDHVIPVFKNKHLRELGEF